MAMTTQSIHLINGGLASGTATWTKITANSKDLCIKDFPDMTNADKDQVETTTLCDTAHQYIDGLENLPEELEFTANFDNDLYDEIATNHTAEEHWGIQYGEGIGSPQWVLTGKARVELKGAGVGDVLEMVIKIRPTSTISKQNATA